MASNRVGISTEVLDGNLRPQIVLPSDVSLVIDRATDGRTDQLYVVTDLALASVEFGANSPLIKQAKALIAGGAASVALYRIGGKAAEIKNIFSEFTSLRTRSASVQSGSDLKVYIGPRPNDLTKACVIVTDTAGKIVFSNSPGGIVDLGRVVVEGFDVDAIPFRVGSPSAPVLFKDVVANLLDGITQVATATANQTAFTLSTSVPDATSNLAVSKTVGSVTTIVSPSAYTKTVATGELTGFTLNTGATAGDIYTISYTKPALAADVTAADIYYVAGQDSMGASLKTQYEIFDSALEDLGNVRVNSVVIGDLFDMPNIGAGSTATDRLEYLYRTDTDQGFVYEWSTNKFLYQLDSDPSLTTTDPLLAAVDSNGQPLVVKRYNEVDFVHRLGTWCQLVSTQSNYVHGVVGVKPPKSSYREAVAQWVGKEPRRDIFGNIIENGTGLLGQRFMAGTTDRAPGFYLTDTGGVDGNVLTDSQGVAVDLGKFLSICTTPVFLNQELVRGGSLVNAKSFAAVYAGFLNTITPGNSTTNAVINTVSPMFTVTETVAARLSDKGYVTLVDKPRGTTIYSGDLATQADSDFDYISTAIAVAFCVRRINIITEPYIGKGLDLILAAALDNAVKAEIAFLVTSGVIAGAAPPVITRNGPNGLAIRLRLITKEELRTIDTSVALANTQLVIGA